MLGTVHHFYCKKKYKVHGAPHYHVLCIRDAPVIGRDDPDEVLVWIQERITCHIPNKESDPELYNLVTRYQCSGYCNRKRKCCNVFITRCKFGSPWIPCESAKLNPVTDSLKSRSKICDRI